MNMDEYIGKYADMRLEVLKNHAPKFYNALIENGCLDRHLQTVQRMSEKYVEDCVDRFLHSDEYARESAKDPLNAMRSLNMTVLIAEDTVFRMWIGVLPEDEEYDDEEDEEEDDDDDDYYDEYN